MAGRLQVTDPPLRTTQLVCPDSGCRFIGRRPDQPGWCAGNPQDPEAKHPVRRMVPLAFAELGELGHGEGR
jgi:hypothetical protein